MTIAWSARHAVTAFAVLLVMVSAATVWRRFSADLTAARIRVGTASTVIDKPCGLIEYQEAGSGLPLLAVHGRGGGYDQGLALPHPSLRRAFASLQCRALAICARRCPKMDRPRLKPMPLSL